MLLRQMCLLLCLVCYAQGVPRARADAPDSERAAAARVAFEEGVQKADAHAWDAAAISFRSALSYRDSPVIRFNLSAALIELGQLLEASTLLTGIAADEHANAGLRERAGRKVALLEARLSHLTVSVAGDAERAQLFLDEHMLAADAYDVARVVDPGPHTLSLRVADDEVDNRIVTLEEGEHAQVSLRVPAPKPAAIAVVPPVVAAAPFLHSPLPRKDEPAQPKRNKALIWAVGGVALAVLAGVVTGVVLANRRSSQSAGAADAFDPPRVGVQVPQ